VSGEWKRMYPGFERLSCPVTGVACSPDFVAVCLDTTARVRREDCVIIFDRVSGRPMYRYGSRTHDGYALTSCVSIRFNPDGATALLVDGVGHAVFVADMLGNVKFSFNVRGSEDPRDAAVHPKGSGVVVLTATTLALYSPSGTFVDWVIPPGSERDRAFTSLCFSPGGACYVADSRSRDVLVFQ
jgi:hypothetical protein